LFEAADVINVDEVEVVPTQVHLPKGPLIHHPGCQPEQKKYGSFSEYLWHFYTIPDLSPHSHQLDVTCKLQTKSGHLKFAINQRHKLLDHRGRIIFLAL
jgi:hypothetical protein